MRKTPAELLPLLSLQILLVYHQFFACANMVSNHSSELFHPSHQLRRVSRFVLYNIVSNTVGDDSNTSSVTLC